MTRYIPSLTAAAVLALSGTALAQDSTKSGGLPGVDVDVNANISMPMADKNSDGKVSKAEAAGNAKLAAQFDQLDANKDGNLDKAEFAKFEGSAKGKASSAKSKVPGNKDGAPGNDEGTGDERAQPVDKPGTTDDSVPGNKDKLGPGR
jgi:hypothetical protein